MEFRILGPLEVESDGNLVGLGRRQQRALLTVLLLEANRVVTRDRLVDLLWGEAPPDRAANALQVYVSQLRASLGRERIVTQPPGYLIRVEPGQLDIERFQLLVLQASPDDAKQTAASLRQALLLWRGPPLVDLPDTPLANAERRRLEELRLSAFETRIDADLALGEHATLVIELETLVREHPFRERLRAQLMLALYRSGRQAEALELFAQGRRLLADELGLDPGDALKQLQKAILEQDPLLASPNKTPAPHESIAGQQADERRPDGSREPVLRKRKHRRSLAVMLAAGALVLASAAAAVDLTRGSASSLSRIAPNSVGVVNARANRIVAQIPVGSTPTSLALAGRSLWVVNSQDRTVSRIDTNKRLVRHVIALPGSAASIATDSSAVWVVYLQALTGEPDAPGPAAAALIDPRFNQVTLTVTLHRSFDYTDAIAVGAGSVWVDDPGYITRIDAANGKIEAVIPIGFAHAQSVIVADHAVWAIGGAGIVRIDPTTNNITSTIPLAQNATGRMPSSTALAFGSGAIWVSNRTVTTGGFRLSAQPGTVSRIDPQTNAVVDTVPVGREPFAIAAAAGAVWVANRYDSTLSRIDPRTNKVVTTISLGAHPQGLAAKSDTLWVTVS